VHQVELALGAIEIALHARPRAALEITERLKQRDGNAQVLAQTADVLRSFSNSSTPSNPAAAAASSFSGRVPLSDTVAIERFMRLLLLPGDSGRCAAALGSTRA